MQAHILGEVGILGSALLRAYSRTILPIFIEIGSYLTDTEQNISWHSFLRHGVVVVVVEVICVYKLCRVNLVLSVVCLRSLQSLWSHVQHFLQYTKLCREDHTYAR